MVVTLYIFTWWAYFVIKSLKVSVHVHVYLYGKKQDGNKTNKCK